MSTQNTFKKWVELQARSFDTIQDVQFLNIDADDPVELDLSKIIPSVEFFETHGITILDQPFHIEGETDQLERYMLELDTYRNDLGDFSHVYSFNISRVFGTMFERKVNIVVRGVKK